MVDLSPHFLKTFLFNAHTFQDVAVHNNTEKSKKNFNKWWVVEQTTARWFCQYLAR